MNNDNKASQPKVESIGDDDHFNDLLHSVELALTKTTREKAKAAMCAYLDSKLRAPADQAASGEMVNVKKYQVMDEFLMYEGDDWNADDCTVSSEGYWVKYEDVKDLVTQSADTPADTPADQAASVAKVVVSLGDTWADDCKICGKRGDFGMASQKGPDGCREALESGEVYCSEHISHAAQSADKPAVSEREKALEKALRIAVQQNESEMLMTGEECRECWRAIAVSASAADGSEAGS